MRAEPVRFKESGVKEIVSRVLPPLWNSYRFFYEQTLLYSKSIGQGFAQQALFEPKKRDGRWILADGQSLLRFMDK